MASDGRIELVGRTKDTITVKMTELNTAYAGNDRWVYWYILTDGNETPSFNGDHAGISDRPLAAYAPESSEFTFTGLNPAGSYWIWCLIETSAWNALYGSNDFESNPAYGYNVYTATDIKITNFTVTNNNNLTATCSWEVDGFYGNYTYMIQGGSETVADIIDYPGATKTIRCSPEGTYTITLVVLCDDNGDGTEDSSDTASRTVQITGGNANPWIEPFNITLINDNTIAVCLFQCFDFPSGEYKYSIEVDGKEMAYGDDGGFGYANEEAVTVELYFDNPLTSGKHTFILTATDLNNSNITASKSVIITIGEVVEEEPSLSFFLSRNSSNEHYLYFTLEKTISFEYGMKIYKDENKKNELFDGYWAYEIAEDGTQVWEPYYIDGQQVYLYILPRLTDDEECGDITLYYKYDSDNCKPKPFIISGKPPSRWLDKHTQYLTVTEEADCFKIDFINPDCPYQDYDDIVYELYFYKSSRLISTKNLRYGETAHFFATEGKGWYSLYARARCKNCNDYVTIISYITLDDGSILHAEEVLETPICAGTLNQYILTLWSWVHSNGTATDEQTQDAYKAIYKFEGYTVNDFSHKVWNDLVDKTYQYATSNDNNGWHTEDSNSDKTYLSYNDTLMTDTEEGRTLTAAKFNSLKFNIGSRVSTDLVDRESGDIVYGGYFFLLANCLNGWIGDYGIYPKDAPLDGSPPVEKDAGGYYYKYSYSWACIGASTTIDLSAAQLKFDNSKNNNAYIFLSCMGTFNSDATYQTPAEFGIYTTPSDNGVWKLYTKNVGDSVIYPQGDIFAPVSYTNGVYEYDSAIITLSIILEGSEVIGMVSDTFGNSTTIRIDGSMGNVSSDTGIQNTFLLGTSFVPNPSTTSPGGRDAYLNNVQLIDGQLLNREGSWVDWLPNSNDRQYTYYVLVTKPEYASYKLEDSTETISISYE